MFNILKKKYIEIFCYTNKKIVYDLFQIKKSNNFYPQWWKNLPKYECPIKSSASMRGCYGFLEYYKQSFTMPLWSDIIFFTNKNGEIDVEVALQGIGEGASTNISRHDERQHIGFFDTNKFSLIKLETPWVFSCKENIYLSTVGPFYENFELLQNIQIVPGITNYHLNQYSNIFLIVKKGQNNIFVKHSTPIRHFFPLTDKKVVFICEYNVKKYEELYYDKTEFSFLNDMYQKIKMYGKIN